MKTYILFFLITASLLMGMACATHRSVGEAREEAEANLMADGYDPASVDQTTYDQYFAEALNNQSGDWLKKTIGISFPFAGGAWLGLSSLFGLGTRGGRKNLINLFSRATNMKSTGKSIVNFLLANNDEQAIVAEPSKKALAASSQS